MRIELVGGPLSGRRIPRPDIAKARHILIGRPEPRGPLVVVAGGSYDPRMAGRRWPIYHVDPHDPDRLVHT